MTIMEVAIPAKHPVLLGQPAPCQSAQQVEWRGQGGIHSKAFCLPSCSFSPYPCNTQAHVLIPSVRGVE